MHEYRVVERWPDARQLGLSCQMGRYHRVHAPSGMPAVEATLNGDKPRLGSAMLSCTASGRIYRVIFEAINQGSASAASGFTPASFGRSQ